MNGHGRESPNSSLVVYFTNVSGVQHNYCERNMMAIEYS